MRDLHFFKKSDSFETGRMVRDGSDWLEERCKEMWEKHEAYEERGSTLVCVTADGNICVRLSAGGEFRHNYRFCNISNSLLQSG